MPAAIRYRTGVDRRSGRLLHGWAHVEQSLDAIWTTRIGARVMRLDFGSNLAGWLGADVTPATALGLYADLVSAAHSHEPEYRIRDLQLVALTAIGGLGLRHRGVYYPEGRFGNYAIAHDQGALSALPRVAALARAAA